MPELPEVETVAKGLSEILGESSTLFEFIFYRDDIRFRLPKVKMQQLLGQRFCKVWRRAKYLVFELERGFLVNHLGMTGSWRRLMPGEAHARGPHDHLLMDLGQRGGLIYCDPRRFGFFEAFASRDELDKYFVELGPEPLSLAFDAEYLFQKSRGRKTSVKAWLMDQKIVVGVGNIYASEALFLARVRPTRRASSLNRVESKKIVGALREVLLKAIDSGGSSIRDYRDVGGNKGQFQSQFHVYGRDKAPCKACGFNIRLKRLSGRSTFYCSRCQR